MFHIIDDEKVILEFLSELIKEMGFEAMAFSCPLDYLSYVDSPEYVVPIAVISDVRMPEMNGFQMLERVRSKYPDIRTAVMSGYFENRGRAEENTCVFLHKPAKVDAIVQMIESFICCQENGKQVCPHASCCKNC